MLGLQGDTSDNIPGIPGIGPKTASELLKQYKTVEGVVAHASELKGKQKERVEQFGEQAILSKKLATIFLEVPVPFDEDALSYKSPDEPKLRPILEELEFKTMIPRVFAASSGSASAPVIKESKPSQLSMFGKPSSPVAETSEGVQENSSASYKRIESDDEIKSLIENLKSQKEISVSIATDEEE